MKEIFTVSLCRGGLLGGAIIAEDESMAFRTGKLTVSPSLRNIEMRYRDVLDVSEGTFILLPSVRIAMKDGGSYEFVVFSRDRFLKMLSEKGIRPVSG